MIKLPWLAPMICLMLLVNGCSRRDQADSEAVNFELRDFTVKEEIEENALAETKWNKFSGSGTISTRDAKFQGRSAFLVVQIKDKSEGDNSEPATQFVLLRDGLGKLETYKSEYNEMVARPEYEWTVLGWMILDGPGKITTIK